MPDRRFAALTPARKSFVRACQNLNFGWIDMLLVVRGEPVFGLETKTRVDLKLNCDDAPRPELALDDFTLSSEVLKSLVALQKIGDGVIDQIEVRAGLPRKMLFTKAC